MSTVIEESRLAKKSGIHVIAIGVGGWIDVDEVSAIASYPSSINVILVPRIEDLPQNEQALQDLVCNRMLLLLFVCLFATQRRIQGGSGV